MEMKVTPDTKLFRVEFGEPDGTTSQWSSNTAYLVLANNYEEAIKKAVDFRSFEVEVGATKKILDCDGSLNMGGLSYQTTIAVKSVVLLADKLVY